MLKIFLIRQVWPERLWSLGKMNRSSRKATPATMSYIFKKAG